MESLAMSLLVVETFFFTLLKSLILPAVKVLVQEI